MSLKSLQDILKLAEAKGTKRLVACAAEDDAVIKACDMARKENIVSVIYVGDLDKIKAIASSNGISLEGIEIIDEKVPAKSAQVAVKIVNEGRADILMKGLVGTADFLRAILDKECGLRKGKLLSHLALFECPNYHKLLGVTDAAQNVDPTLEDKVSIVQNAVELFHSLGVSCPKVAAIAAVEVVNPKMIATVDAAALTLMNRRKQIKGCIIDGPLALDNAVSKEAAVHKGIESEVAGDADLIVTHDINMGNTLYKALGYLAGAGSASVLLGAKVPVVLTSRADSDMSKLQSIALAALLGK